MKKLTEQFQEILRKNKVEATFPEGAHLIPDLLQAVKERDTHVIGEDEVEVPGKDGWKYMPEQRPRNQLKAEQRKRAGKTL